MTLSISGVDASSPPCASESHSPRLNPNIFLWNQSPDYERIPQQKVGNVFGCRNTAPTPQPYGIMFANTARLSLYVFVSLVMCTHSQARALDQNSGARMANHAFSFGGIGISENTGIEILNFQYGDSKAVGTYVEDARLSTGHIGQSGMVRGTMPVGDFLYVKWLILASGKVVEDRVDLKKHLPSDMDHKIVHFAISEQQLSVYLIEGNTSKQLHAIDAPDCPSSSYKQMKCKRIYPDSWSNF